MKNILVLHLMTKLFLLQMLGELYVTTAVIVTYEEVSIRICLALLYISVYTF